MGRYHWLRAVADAIMGVYGAARQLSIADALFMTVALAVACLLLVIALGHAIPPSAALVLATLVVVGMLVYLPTNLYRSRLVRFFREAIESTPSAFALYDEKDRLIACNKSYQDAHAGAFAKLKAPIRYADLVRATLETTMSGEELERELRERLRRHHEATGEASDRLYPNGRWLRVQKIRTVSGANVGVAIDVTALHEANAAAERERARFRSVAETLPVGIWHFDGNGRTLFVNGKLLQLFGLDDVTALDGVDARSFISERVQGFGPFDRQRLDDGLGNLTISGSDGRACHVLVRTSETSGPLTAAGETILTFIDVTQLKEAERRIDFLARRDLLTGARNRAAFVDAIETAERTASDGKPFWLMAMDLDGFKPINDQYGHAAGDTVLRQLVQRIDALRPDGCQLYRLGGDEFAIVASGLAVVEVTLLAEAILAAIEQPFNIGTTEVHVWISIGIAGLPRDTTDAETALRYADLALYSVKNAGGRGYAFFTRALAERDLDERVLALDINRAIAGDEFELALQPLFASAGQRIVAAEALLRWRNLRTGRDIPPSEFIPVAERRGLIARIDMWVIARVGEILTRWTGADLAVPRVMVNTSPITIDSRDYLDGIDLLLARYPVLRNRLVIEITEGVAVRDPQRLRAIFAELRAREIGTAIDDFGVGQTSVALLRDLPVDFIRIDRSFVDGIDRDPQTLAIIRTVIRLGGELGVQVVAEGVETPAQLEALARSGCALVQGFLLARPETVETFAARLKASAAEASAI